MLLPSLWWYSIRQPSLLLLLLLWSSAPAFNTQCGLTGWAVWYLSLCAAYIQWDFVPNPLPSAVTLNNGKYLLMCPPDIGSNVCHQYLILLLPILLYPEESSTALAPHLLRNFVRFSSAPQLRLPLNDVINSVLFYLGSYYHQIKRWMTVVCGIPFCGLGIAEAIMQNYLEIK